MSDLKINKLNKIINYVTENNISAYVIAKNTGISEAGVGKILNKVSINPREHNINLIYNYLFIDNNILVLKKDGVEFSIEEIALFVVNNENEFMKIKAFSNMAELRARNKVIEIMEKKRSELN